MALEELDLPFFFVSELDLGVLGDFILLISDLLPLEHFALLFGSLLGRFLAVEVPLDCSLTLSFDMLLVTGRLGSGISSRLQTDCPVSALK